MLNVYAKNSIGFNGVKGKPFRVEDIRFTYRTNAPYTIVQAHPKNNKVSIKSVKLNNAYNEEEIGKKTLLADSAPPTFNRTAKGLDVYLLQNLSQEFAYTLKYYLHKSTATDIKQQLQIMRMCRC